MKNEIEENQSSKKLWKTIKQIGQPSKSKSDSNNICLTGDDREEIFDSNIVAFFYIIASKLVQTLPNRDFDDEK